MGQVTKTYKLLPGKQFLGPMNVLEDSSKMDLRETPHDEFQIRTGAILRFL
jgi:hypothetical protein